MKITIELNSIEELKEFEQHCALSRIENLKMSIKVNEKSSIITRLDSEAKENKVKLMQAEAKVRSLEKKLDSLEEQVGVADNDKYARQLNEEEKKEKGFKINENEPF